MGSGCLWRIPRGQSSRNAARCCRPGRAVSEIPHFTLAAQSDAEAAAVAAAARRAAPQDGGGVSVSDEAMAAALSRAQARNHVAGVSGSGREARASGGNGGAGADLGGVAAVKGEPDGRGCGILRFDSCGSSKQQGGKRAAEERVKPLRDPKRKKHERK